MRGRVGGREGRVRGVGRGKGREGGCPPSFSIIYLGFASMHAVFCQKGWVQQLPEKYGGGAG